MLNAMRRSCLSAWRVERRHEIAGLILWDILREEEVWLVDEGMEQYQRRGFEFAARLLKLEGFAISARIVVPIVADWLEVVRARAPPLMQVRCDVLASDPRLMIAAYRAAVATGPMDAVVQKDPG